MTCLAMLDQSTFVSYDLLCWLFWVTVAFFCSSRLQHVSVGSPPLLPMDLFSPCILSFHLKSGRYGSFHTDICALLWNLHGCCSYRGFSCGFAHETWTVLLSENADCSTLYMHFPPSLLWRCSLWIVLCIAKIIQRKRRICDFPMQTEKRAQSVCCFTMLNMMRCGQTACFYWSNNLLLMNMRHAAKLPVWGVLLERFYMYVGLVHLCPGYLCESKPPLA